MAGACLACIVVVHYTSADGAVDLVRHQDHTPATEVSAMSVGTNASALGWARLLMGFPQRGWVLRHSSEDGLGRAHGGVVDIARSRSL